MCDIIPKLAVVYWPRTDYKSLAGSLLTYCYFQSIGIHASVSYSYKILDLKYALSFILPLLINFGEFSYSKRQKCDLMLQDHYIELIFHNLVLVRESANCNSCSVERNSDA